MRIISLLAVAFAALTFGLAGCGGAPEPEQAPAELAQQRSESQLPICLMYWTCNSSTFFASQSSCEASSCGAGNCYLDYRCNSSCTCP